MTVTFLTIESGRVRTGPVNGFVVSATLVPAL